MDFSHFSNNDLCSNFQGTFFILVSCWKQKISSVEPYSADLRPTEAFLKTPGFALSEGSEPKRSLKKVLDNLVNDFLVLQAEKCISKTVEMTDQSLRSHFAHTCVRALSLLFRGFFLSFFQKGHMSKLSGGLLYTCLLLHKKF